MRLSCRVRVACGVGAGGGGCKWKVNLARELVSSTLHLDGGDDNNMNNTRWYREMNYRDIVTQTITMLPNIIADTILVLKRTWPSATSTTTSFSLTSHPYSRSGYMFTCRYMYTYFELLSLSPHASDGSSTRPA